MELPRVDAQHLPDYSFDALTGAFTRSDFEPIATTMLQQAAASEQPCALVLLDLDHFKSINDGFGHARGDAILINVVQRIRGVLRQTDSIIRYGGDEFALLLHQTTRQQARTVLSNLLENFQRTPVAGEPPLTVTFSAGVAIYPDDSTEFSELFHHADKRHYLAKRRGRAQVVTDDTPQAEPLLPLTARLIERDQALNCFQQFLAELPHHWRGLLRLVALRGVGITRFLTEIAQRASQQRYLVLSIAGNAGLLLRKYGVLHELRETYSQLAAPEQGIAPWVASIEQMARAQHQQGVLILLDNPHQIDPASLEFVRDLLFSEMSLPLSVIYPLPSTSSSPVLAAEVEYHTEITLQPLSERGVQAWLRYHMQWEAPLEFRTWLHQTTGGLPARIEQSIRYLIEQHIVTPPQTAGSWHYQLRHADTALHTHLEQHTRQLRHDLLRNVFIGHTPAIYTIRRLIRQHRLVTIFGAGGMGKTRLAVQVVYESAQHFPDGVYLVELSAVHTRENLIGALLYALHITALGQVDPLGQVVNLLRRRSTLLIFDNCEHLLQPLEGLINHLLEHTSSTHLLLTSRQPINHMLEQTFAIGSLPVPQAGEQNIAAVEACQLFLHAVHQVLPDLSPTPEELADIARICRTVRGMPLAIILAGRSIRTRSCAAIAREIEHNLIALTDNAPDISERHRYVIAVVESFWQELSDYERKVLRQLAIFQGGFHAEAAAYIADASRFFLGALGHSGYLTAQEGQRYQLHELLRQYAQIQLARDAAEVGTVAQQHASYFASYVYRHTPKMHHERAAIDAISSELGNIRAGLLYALQRMDAALLEQFAGGLQSYYLITAKFHEGAHLFRTACAMLQENLQHTTQGMPFIRTHQYLLSFYRISLGWMLVRMGEYTEAQELANLIRTQAHECGVLQLAVDASVIESTALLRQGQLAVAHQMIASCMQAAQRNSSSQSQLLTLLEYGVNLFYRAHHDQAIQLMLEQGLPLSRASGNRYIEVRFLNLLGLVSLEQGRLNESRTYLLQALPISRDLSARQIEGHILSNLGEGSLRLGDWHGCQLYAEQTLAICREIGDVQNESEMLICYALLMCYQQELLQATRLCHLSREQALRLDARFTLGKTFLVEGRIALAGQQFTAATHAFAQALEIFAGVQHAALESEARAGSVQATLAQGQLKQALHHTALLLPATEHANLYGAYEPLQVHLACYRALHAAGDARAPAVLRRGLARLEAQAASLTPEQQADFYVNVPAHRHLRELGIA